MLKPSLILSLMICFVSSDAFAQADEETNNDNTSRQTDNDKKKEEEKKQKTINTAKQKKFAPDQTVIVRLFKNGVPTNEQVPTFGSNINSVLSRLNAIGALEGKTYDVISME